MNQQLKLRARITLTPKRTVLTKYWNVPKLCQDVVRQRKFPNQTATFDLRRVGLLIKWLGAGSLEVTMVFLQCLWRHDMSSFEFAHYVRSSKETCLHEAGKLKLLASPLAALAEGRRLCCFFLQVVHHQTSSDFLENLELPMDVGEFSLKSPGPFVACVEKD